MVVHDNGVETDGSGGDAGPANDVAAAICAGGGRAVACASDARTELGGRAAVDLAVGEFGRLDAIVANAGIIHDDPFTDWPTERSKRCCAITSWPPFTSSARVSP